SLGRRVALKVLPFAAALDARQLKRFKNEAQAAANLHHTNIVPVYAVGCERGVHYYAMQLIDGRPLAEVIDELRRSPRPASPPPSPGPGGGEPAGPPQPAGPGEETPPLAAGPTSGPAGAGAGFFRTVAELGIQAAEALEHAHQAGVVHRDVKPSNLLVDGRGHLWVTDFGLALVQTDVTLTLTGDLVGTLRYMSPEQALGHRGLVDHRTDVYSLGATLYELLALRPAFEGNDRQELLRRIASEEPCPPRRVNRSVPAELETIVLKAMAKEPAERYATAGEMADDLRRWLEHRPVLARRPTPLQRLRKLLRRHWEVALTAASGLALTLAVAVTVLAVSRHRIAREQEQTQQALEKARGNYELAERQRRRAEANLRNAVQAVDEYLTGVSENALLREPGLEPLREQLLDAALRYYKDFVAQHAGDAGLRAELAAAHLRITQLTIYLGTGEDWLSPFQAALAILEDLLQQEPDAAVFRSLRAGIFRPDAAVELPIRRPDEALRTFEAARGVWEKLARADPTAPGFRNDLAAIHLVIGELRRARQPAEALPSYLSAHDLWEQLARANPGEPLYRAALANQLNNLAGLWAQLGDLRRAEEASRDCLEIAQQLVTDIPDVPALRELLAQGYAQLGALREYAGRPGEAEGAYRRMLTAYEHLAQGHPAVPRYRAWVLRARLGLGEVLWATGRRDEAAEEYGRARALGERLPPEESEGRNFFAWLLATCPDPQFRDPRRAAEVAADAVRRAPDDGARRTTLGAALYGAGDDRAAVEALGQATRLPNNRASAARFFLAMAYRRLGENEQALRWYNRAAASMRTELRGEETRRLRAEAERLLGIEKKKDSPRGSNGDRTGRLPGGFPGDPFAHFGQDW
ncbi:MAG TPA: protein kinase, partial [Gemmataceae bacterium]